MSPRVSWLPLLIIAVLLSGCIEMTQEVWIEEDGSARLVRELAMSSDLLGASSGGTMAAGAPSISGPSDAIALGLEEARSDLEASDLVTSCTVTETTGGNQHHFILDVHVKDALKLGEVDRLLQKSSGGEDGSNNLPGGWTLDVTKRLNGNYVVKMSAPEDTSAAPGDEASDHSAANPADAMAEAMGQAFMSSFFEGKDFTVIIHGPRIASSTGTISSDRTSALWTIPMAQLASKKGFEEELVAEIKMPGLPLFAIAVAGGGVLGAGALGFGAFKFARRRGSGGRRGSRASGAGADVAGESLSTRGHWRTSAG